jgi:hypothetical protein
MRFLTELNHRRAIVLLTTFLCGLGNGSQTVLAQQYHLTGKWTTLPYLMPINPIHVGLLHTNTSNIGKLLIVAGSENNPNKHLQGSSKAAVWDVSATNSLFTILDLPWDVFCNGGTFLADGRSIVVGGTVEYDPFYGDARMTVFDPVTAKFNELHSMTHGRWYATAITLGDGRALAFSGLDENGNTNSNIEIYQVASGWTAPNQAPFTPTALPLAASLTRRSSLLFRKFVQLAYFQPQHLSPNLGNQRCEDLFWIGSHLWKLCSIAAASAE